MSTKPKKAAPQPAAPAFPRPNHITIRRVSNGYVVSTDTWDEDRTSLATIHGSAESALAKATAYLGPAAKQPKPPAKL